MLWTPLLKKVTITSLLATGPWKNNHYFATRYWALKKVTISSLFFLTKLNANRYSLLPIQALNKTNDRY